MNIQELVKRYEEILINGKSDSKSAHIYRTFLRELRQLDEQQKVKVPQCVGDYIEHAKESEWDLEDLFEFVGDQECGGIQKWFYDECNQDTLALAWIFGFTVEKEKRYRVKMKNIHSYSSILKLDDITGEYFFGSEAQMCASSSTHTCKELEEAGFGKVFDSPLFEVEEVE